MYGAGGMLTIPLVLVAVCSVVQGKYNFGLILLDGSKTHRFDIQRIGPAVDIALDKCKYVYNVTLTKRSGLYTKSCSEKLSIGRATDLVFTEKISAFLGPACSTDLSIVAKFASYRNIPILSGLGDTIQRSEEEVSTLIRTSYDLGGKANAIIGFLQHFNWSTFGVVYREKDVYYDTLFNKLQDIVEMRKPNLTISCYQYFYRNAKTKEVREDLMEIMRYMKSCSRVIVLLTGEKEVRRMLEHAKELGMTSDGQYAFLYPELFQSEAQGNITWTKGVEKSRQESLKAAFQSLLIITLNQSLSSTYLQFSEEVIRMAKEKYNWTYTEKVVNYYTASFHDAVLLLCNAISSTLDAGEDPRNGSDLLKRMKNVTLEGISGPVRMNENGDRIARYALLDQTDIESGKFEVVYTYFEDEGVQRAENASPIHWPGERNEPPRDVPLCGFDGLDPKCVKEEDNFPYHETIIFSVLTVLILMMFCAVLIYRKMQLESALANMSWRIKWEEISFTRNQRSSWIMSRLSITSASTVLEPLFKGNDPQFILTGTYKGTVVAVKRLPIQKRIELARAVLIELKQMRETQHENVARFVGACIDPPNIAIITEYCPKGSLQDVLHNESLKLEWLFRYSLINDIVKGMSFLHSSEIGTHGRLRSSNCVVDSHFVLKITDFGLPSFRLEETYHAYQTENQKKFLWKAPELLRLKQCPSGGSQKGDVYSFGIILQEIILREEPFYPHTDLMDIPHIIDKIIYREEPPFRPIVDKDACIPDLYRLMAKCWSEDPDDRPSFAQIKVDMRVINRGTHGEVNIMDNMLVRMEQYANELEALVEQRTAAFLEEKRKSEDLLYQVLPRSVAEQLKKGRAVIPELYDSVTIYFSDIVGFTNMCSVSTPIQVVDFLNDLYTCFDSVTSDFDVYKVETIGDAYMVVSGLPDRNGWNHAKEIARMALSLLNAVKNFRIRHRPNDQLNLRIGIHTGPCCAGVVGQKMPRYCLFGDTVNTASRMESTGEALRIHVSPTTKEVLEKFGTFILEPRGEIEVKGKGCMHTFWLSGENGSEELPPSFPKMRPSPKRKNRHKLTGMKY